MDGMGSECDVLPSFDGYHEPYPFRYSMIRLFLLTFPLALLSLTVFGRMYEQFHGMSMIAAVFEPSYVNGSVTYVVDLTWIFLLLLIASMITVIIHELVHGMIMWWYGKSVSFGVIPTKGVFYVASFGQYMTRRESILTALGPLIVITIGAIPLMAVVPPLYAIVVFFILVVNATGAVGDIYLVWRLLHLPKGTLLYDESRDTSYLYEPKTDSSSVAHE